eukprot:4625614-Amphidinium_carterae.2
MQETSWANIVKGKAKLTVEHSPEKLRLDWGDVEDSDTDDDEPQQQDAETDHDDADMDDGPDNRKRAGDALPQAAAGPCLLYTSPSPRDRG